MQLEIIPGPRGFALDPRSILPRQPLGDIETWEPSEAEQIAIENGYMQRRTISVTGDNLPKRELCVYRFAAAGASAAAVQTRPRLGTQAPGKSVFF